MGLTIHNPSSTAQPALTLSGLLFNATRVFGDSETANEWVNEPIPSLGGRKPAEMMAGSLDDKQRVCMILGRIEHGIF